RHRRSPRRAHLACRIHARNTRALHAPPSGVTCAAWSGLLRKSTLITVALSAALGGCGSSGATVGNSIVFSPHHHNAHNAIVRVVTARRWVAVTFDDGPDRHWTPRFLRLLARYHAHGTFFFIGRRALAAPSAVVATLRSG